MVTARAPESGPSLVPWVLVGALALAGIAIWLGYPGLVLLPVGITVAAYLAPPAILTGKKDVSGFPTAVSPAEQKGMNRYRMWGELKFKSLVPSMDWLPGWPLRMWWLVSIPLSAAAIALPSPELGDAWRFANAAGVFITMNSLNGAIRRWTAPDDLSPGPTLDVYIAQIKSEPKYIAITVIAAIVSAGVFLGTVLAIDRFALNLYIDPVLPWHVGTAIALTTLFTILTIAVRGLSLQKWRTMVRVRAEWSPRWVVAKIEPAPRLIDHIEIGNIQVDTFEAHPTVGASPIYQAVPKITATLASGSRVAVLESPNLDSQNQPVEGTKHPLRFRVATFITDDMPDLNNPSLDAAEAEIFIAASASWASDSSGYGRWVLLGVEPLHRAPAGDEEAGGTGAWTADFAMPDGPSAKDARDGMLGAFSDAAGCEVLIDHKANKTYFGSLTSGNTDFEDPRMAKTLSDIALTDLWASRWSNILKMGAVQPRPEHGVFATAQIGNATLSRQPFVVQQGMDPLEFFKLEPKISTTLSAAPFVSVTGFAGQGDRPGERHPQAFCVTWSQQAVASNADKLTPTEGSAPMWILAGRMNQAFDAAKLARPEVAEVRALTDPKSRGHIWEIKLRLFGVTLAEVRASAEKLRQAMGSDWLRVAQSKDGCVIVVGADPKDVRRITFARPEHKNRDYVTSLDWEQAFSDAKVQNLAGVLPKLTRSGTLPANEQVQVLDFKLPTGTSRGQLSEAVSKLMTTTGNQFVEPRDSPDGADSVRLLVSRENPLPARAGFDWDAVDKAEGIPFSTGIEGESVEFDSVNNPHILLAGMTGAGKSVMAQAFLYGALVRGAILYVIDPVKGGADFQFAKDYATAFAATPFEAQAVMKAIYAEVVKRKNTNAEHGVGSFMELPEPPPRIYVMIDEFTSLMGQDAVPPASDDPETELEREQIIAINRAKIDVGIIAGKLAREARSAGVHLLLGTQKLSAKMLDSIPGANDLKTNLARTILGKTSSGDLMSALRAFADAPVLTGEIPKGRGLYEPLTGTARAIQVWYASQEELREQLRSRREPIDESDKLDLAPLMAKKSADATPQDAPTRAPNPFQREPDVVTVGEFVFELDDLDDLDDEQSVETASTTEASKTVLSVADADGTLVLVAPGYASTAAEFAGKVIELPAEQSDEVDLFGWWKIDAAASIVDDFGIVDRIVWVDPEAQELSESGVTNGQLAVEVFADEFIEVTIVDIGAAAQPAVEPSTQAVEVSPLAPAPPPVVAPAPPVAVEAPAPEGTPQVHTTSVPKYSTLTFDEPVQPRLPSVHDDLF